MYIACNCSGFRRNTHGLTPMTQQRERGSRRNNCPFLALGWRNAGILELTVRVGNHNHNAMTLSSHPTLRHLDAGQGEVVSSLTSAGVRPQQIQAHLQQSCSTAEELPLIPQDIYNLRFQLMREALNGQTPIQALLS